MDTPSDSGRDVARSQPSTLGSNRRSRNGCWTCKSRRQKCDERHPTCATCARMNLYCEGYERRLTWGVGIASRGHQAGATRTRQKPQKGQIEPAKKGQKKRVPRTSPPPSLSSGDSCADSHTTRDDEASLNHDERRESPSSAESNLAYRLPRNVEELTPQESSLSGEDPGGSSFTSFMEREIDFQEWHEPEVEFSRNELDSIILREFQEYGHRTLASIPDEEESPFLLYVFPLHVDSESLTAVCLAYQTALNTQYGYLFKGYYAEALRAFRKDLCDPVKRAKDGTLAAGLLLCSVGMTRRLPWTVHLKGLYAMLSDHCESFDPETFIGTMVEMIGWFDQPAFIVGRQTETLHIWRRYCCNTPASITGIDEDSGLPRSLIRLFSYVEEAGAEIMLWMWPGEDGEFVQCHLWDAFRFAGMLSAREIQDRIHASNQNPDGDNRVRRPTPSTRVLTIRILASIDAIRRACRDNPKDRLLAYNKYMYPLFIAGCQVEFLNESRKAFIEETFREIMDGRGFGTLDPYYETPMIILRDVWAGMGTADEIARNRGWEVNLSPMT